MNASGWPVPAGPTAWSPVVTAPVESAPPFGTSVGGTSPSITGGGSIAIDTVEMDRAARVLADARTAIADLAGRADAVAAGATGAGRAYLDRALDLLLAARSQADRAVDGLRTAAVRYGEAEAANERALRRSAAVDGVQRGMMAPVLLSIGGPEGLLVAAVLHLGPVAAAIASRLPLEILDPRVRAPWSDPVLISQLRAGISSLDDEARATVGLERDSDLGSDDPASLMGTAAISAALGRIICRPQGDRIRLMRTSTERVGRPGSIAELALRIPDAATPKGGKPGGQVRIEEYGAAGDRHWIVYSAGTVTFLPDGGEEPFDLGSNLAGVGDVSSDSQRAVLLAMREAGIGRDEPVLFVGHSQGALNAVRLAEHSGYDVGGVVQFGGPTGQIALPADVPVLAVEHDQDLVPALGGMAAIGGAGLNRVLIRRTLPDLAPSPDATFPASFFPAHDTHRYAETTRLMEQAGDPRLQALRARWSPFLDGTDESSAVRFEAQRLSGPAGPARTAAGGSGRRPNR